MRFWDWLTSVISTTLGIVSAVGLLIFIVAVLGGGPSSSFEGNALPGWDCQTPMGITSGSIPNTILVVYRATDGKWIYKSYSQSGLKNGKPFYSEHCPKGIPLPTPLPTIE